MNDDNGGHPDPCPCLYCESKGEDLMGIDVCNRRGDEREIFRVECYGCGAIGPLHDSPTEAVREHARLWHALHPPLPWNRANPFCSSFDNLPTSYTELKAFDSAESSNAAIERPILS